MPATLDVKKTYADLSADKELLGGVEAGSHQDRDQTSAGNLGAYLNVPPEPSGKVSVFR